MEQRITISDIETKEFHVAAKGYNQHEVDEFLDAICDEIERMEGEIARLKNAVEMNKAVERKEAASSGYAKPSAGDSSVDEIIKFAIDMAKTKAAEIEMEAKLKAEQIVADAQSKAAAKLGSLEEEQKDLIAQITSMKASAKEYREKFAELLRVHQEALAQAEEL